MTGAAGEDAMDQSRCAHCGMLFPEIQAYQSEHAPPVWLHTRCFDAWLKEQREGKKPHGDSLRDRLKRAQQP